MKRLVLGLLVIGLLSSTGYTKTIEQTICFSKTPSFKMDGRQYYNGSLGDK